MTTVSGPSTTQDPRVVYVSSESGLAQDWQWVADTAERFDIVHWHDGVEGMTLVEARNLVRAIAEAGKPLVVTLPRPDTSTTECQAFGELIAAASLVIAVDAEQAAEVWKTWGRDCLVLAPTPGADGEGEGEADLADLYRQVVAERPYAHSPTLATGGPNQPVDA